MPEREVWSSHQTRMKKMSKSLSKRFFFLSSDAVMFFVSKNKTKKILWQCVMLLCPGALYLQAIKLNKENNTSLVVTLVNYFLRISSMFLWDFSGFCIFSYFLNGISGLSLFTECFLHNYSILRKCWFAHSDDIALICSLIIAHSVVCEIVIEKNIM